jgi:hypothetical protein
MNFYKPNEMKPYLTNKIALLLLVVGMFFISSQLFSQADLCSGASAIADGTTCSAVNFKVKKGWGNEITSPSCCTSYRDGWYTFTASATNYTITGTNTSEDLAMAVYTGCAAGNSVVATCTNAVVGAGTENIYFTATIGQVYMIRLMKADNAVANNMNGTLCVYHSTAPPANDDCAGAIATACAGTYTGSTALATVGADPAGACGTTAGTPSVWYSFAGNGQFITASLCGSTFDTKIQVYSGPCAGPLVCIGGNDDAGGACGVTSVITWSSVPATNYFILVGGSGGATGTYSLTMSCTAPSVPNCSVKTAPVNSSTLTCNSTNFTWNIPIGGGPPTQYNLFFGTDAAATNINNGTNLGNVLSYAPPALLSNTTYFWRIVPVNGVGSAIGCTTFSFTTGGSIAANDNCAGAIALVSGVTINDDNSCATNELPLAIGSCWGGGSVNSLWYSIVVPASGILGVLTSSITLADTQIQVYSGTCAALVQTSCNNDAPGPGCAAAVTTNSQLNLTGLAAGTYYIRVDGINSTVGTYNIMASTTGLVGSGIGVAGSDCVLPIIYCSFPVSIPDPGYFNSGNICDFDGSGNCLLGGEQNALWVKFTALTAGNIAFNIIPNDYGGCNTESDYDWVLYRTAGAGAVTCTSIKNTGGVGSLGCNYSAQGVTGMSAIQNAPASGDQPTNGTSGFNLAPAPGVGCYNSGYQPTVAAALGDVFILVIQNYANTNIGFQLTIPVMVGIAALGNPVPSTLMWTSGAASSTFSNSVNWSNCVAPSCSPAIDAIVLAGPANQPVVNINTNVKSLLINPSATLTINSGIVLNVCGDFINNGQLRCLPGSTVNFNGTGTQLVSGSLLGINKFSNFIVNKSTGFISLTNNIEVDQTFSTSPTSTVNTNGTDFTINGDFINSNGANTFTGITSTSNFIFDGSVAQIYNPNANTATPTLTLCSVTMKNTSTGVTLSATNTPSLVLNTTGVLTLTSGKIITPGLQEVIVMNTDNTAVSTGNGTSYVQGNLRRYLAANATGPFDFPVGHVTPGYERANINFKTGAAAGAINLLARFDPWGGAWTLPAAPNWSECATTYNNPYLNNGYWSIDASSPSTGSYDLTLYNLGYTTTSAGWSIAKSPSGGPAWALNGTCLGTPVTAVVRKGMSGFSKFSTVQGSTPLPVELIYFNAISAGMYNNIFWKSAVEINFKQYELESSDDGINFNKIATINPIGNLSSYNNYDYLDFNFFKPITYYRLKMIDLDYTFKYSNIVPVEYEKNKIDKFFIFPNPASNELYVSIVSPNNKEALLEIKDILGRSIYQQKIDLTQGVENTYINTSDFANGTYIVSVSYGNSSSENTKVVITGKN